MERHVKERLVGAAVLMAAAIILIPEMLSGPDRDDAEQMATTREGTVKTYTIDLNHPPGSQPQQEVVKETAPPPESSTPQTGQQEAPAQQASPAPIPGPETKANPESLRPSESSRAAGASVPPPESSPPVAQEPPASTSPRTTPQSAPALASEPAVPTSRGWAIQLGSFSSQASAQRLAADFRSDRYDAFVMPVKSGSATLYRVRIGPMKDRAAADEVLRAVKAKVAGAAVVAHP